MGITLELYGRLAPGMQEGVAECVDAARRAAINRRIKGIGWQSALKAQPPELEKLLSIS